MSNVTIYKTVLAAVKEGASVTQADLDEANAYAKRAKRGQIKDAKIKVVRKTKNAGVVCDGNEAKGESCDRDAKAKGKCMKHYIQVYRADDANRQRANEASKRYAAKKRAAKA